MAEAVKRLRNEQLRRRASDDDDLREKVLTPDEVRSVSDQRTKKVVYFCRLGDLLKIGTTDRPKTRLKQHQTEARRHRGRFEVLAVVAGGKLEESLLHRHFSHLAADGEAERFRLEPELLEYIRWLRDQYQVEVGSEYADGIPQDALAWSDYAAWGPGPERRKESPDSLFQDTFSARVRTPDDYYTDPKILEVARKALGEFDLDPASHVIANQTVRAKRFYSKQDDGLIQAWHGRIWLNPPFSLYPAFATKLVLEHSEGRAKELIVLASLPALSAQYMEPVLRAARLLFILTGRIPFVGPLASFAESSSPAGYALLYLGHRAGEVGSIFQASGLGVVWRG